MNDSERKHAWYMANRERLLARERKRYQENMQQIKLYQANKRDNIAKTCGLKKCECSPQCQKMIPELTRAGKPAKYARGHALSGPLSPNWKGGVSMHSNGYRLIKMPKHPRADHHGYVGEHVLVLEEKLGRRLLREEEPHHINGIKTDNRPDNLQVFTHSEHTRFHDKLRKRNSKGTFVSDTPSPESDREPNNNAGELNN